MRRSLLPALCLLAACHSAPRPAPTPIAPPPATTAQAPVAPPPVDPDRQTLPLWTALRTGRLSNGLRYFVLPRRPKAPRALLWLAVDAGSILEDGDQRGLAHFVEHMAFNGTQHFPKQAIVQYLESIGMRFGADLNAYTNFDQTVYQLEIPTDRPETLPKGLEILREWAGNVSFDDKEVDAERGVVREEWRLGQGAGQRVFDKQAPTLLTGSRYADRLTIGQLDIIEKAPVATIRRFYRDWYRPDLMAIVVVGDVDENAVEKMIVERFGDLKNPTPERPRIPGGTPTANGTRVSIVMDREAANTTVSLVHPVPTRGSASQRDYRRILTEQLFQMLLNQRFNAITRHVDAPFLGAATQIAALTRSFDAFTLAAMAKPGQADAALRGMLAELARIERHGFLATEFARAKIDLMREMEHAVATDHTVDNRLFAAEIIRYAFEGELMVGRKEELALTKIILPLITLDDMAPLAHEFANAKNRVVLITAPEGEAVPPPAAVLATIAEVATQTVAPWVEKPATGALMTTPPAPGRIVAEKKLDAIGAVQWTLSNGVRVIVKKTDYSGDEVRIAGWSPGGAATLRTNEVKLGALTVPLIASGGVAEYDEEELQQLLTGKRVEVDLSIDETNDSVQARGSGIDLETLLQLVHLRMTAPRLDAAIVTTAKAKYVDLLNASERDPDFQFAKRSKQALWHNDPRRRALTVDDITKADPKRALAIYRERFGDAGDWSFVIVGSFEVATLRPMVEQYFGGLPATKKREVERDLKVRRVPGVVKRSWQIGQAPKARVELEFHGDATWTRDGNRDINNLAATLEIRLREILREDKGGVYNVSVAGEIERAPHQERTFTIAFGCDPSRVDELIATTFAEIRRLQQEGVAPEYLVKVSTALRRERELDVHTNEGWASWLREALVRGDDPALMLDLEAAAKRVTNENLKAAAKRFLDEKQYFQAVLLPEAPSAK